MVIAVLLVDEELSDSGGSGEIMSELVEENVDDD